PPTTDAGANVPIGGMSRNLPKWTPIEDATSFATFAPNKLFLSSTTLPASHTVTVPPRGRLFSRTPALIVAEIAVVHFGSPAISGTRSEGLRSPPAPVDVLRGWIAPPLVASKSRALAGRGLTTSGLANVPPGTAGVEYCLFLPPPASLRTPKPAYPGSPGSPPH